VSAVSMLEHHRLGSWKCPSGNSVDVDLVPVRGRLSMLTFAWDELPLPPADEAYYHTTIRPAVVRLVVEYKEITGHSLVVEP